jgi:hypothetical protein
MLMNPAFSGNQGKGFQPQEVEIDGKTYTAKTPAELEQLNTKKRNVQLKKEGKNPDGSPIRPEWDSMLGKDNMIDQRYQLNQAVQDAMSDDVGFQKFQDEALRDGPSTFADLMLQRRDLDRQDQLGDISSQYQMGLANSMDQMAAQGGIGSGARERMGANSIRSLLEARQGARRDYRRDRLGILAQDEQNRIGQLQSLTGMEMDRNRMGLQGREFDITNSLQERDARRQADLDKWTQERQDWAGIKQAEAQKGAGGGCFPKGTLIDMADGSKKSIERVSVGDRVDSGGVVTKTIEGTASGAEWYDYKGVIVTGDHAVFDGEEWVRVKDTDEAKLLGVEFERLYNLSTEDHEIIINGVVFSDFDEVDDQRLSDEECLKLKNRGVYV